MMKLLRNYCWILLFFIANPSYADSFYCINNNQAVSTGDSMDAVQTACGAPTSISTRTDMQNTPYTVQEWIYTTPGVALTPQGAMLGATVPSLVFFLQNDRVTQIQRNGTAVSGSVSCGIAQAIGVNSSGEMIRLACGNPTYIQNLQQNQSSTQLVTIWTYNRGPYQPMMIFEFENGKLARIKSGQLGN